MGVERFEDLIAWQKARSLTHAIYQASKQPGFGADWGLQRQIQRAAVSVMSNIAEGFERFGHKEFARYLVMAKGSAGEVSSQLYVAFDLEYIDEKQFHDLQVRCNEVKKLITSLRASVLRDNHA